VLIIVNQAAVINVLRELCLAFEALASFVLAGRYLRKVYSLILRC